MTAPRRMITHALVVALGVAAVVLMPVAAQAQVPDAESRSMTLDRQDVELGEALIASMVGLRGESLTLSVCGNLAKRGSMDCANDSSVSDEIVPDGISYTQIVVQPPPAPCPCIVRAIANDTRDFMVAAVTILGHPVAEVVSPGNEPLVEVTVDAQRAPGGFVGSLRSALGGRTAYEVTVSVRNVTTETLTRLALSGSVGGWADEFAAELDPEPPAELAPGQTWTQDLMAEVSAPSLGRYAFEVVASGAGSPVTGIGNVAHHPWLLYLFAVVLVGDLVLMVWRWIAPRATALDDDDPDYGDDGDGDGDDYGDDGDLDHIDDVDVIDLRPVPAPAHSAPVPVGAAAPAGGPVYG